MKKVSVIIPCYNAEKYLHQCLDSIVMQTYSNLEIICINDGSSDKTLTILEKYQRQDNRIKVFSQENQGLSATRTMSIKKATGNFLTFVDNDDWLELNTIEDIMKAEDGEDVFIFSYVREFSESSAIKDLRIAGTFEAADVQRRIVGPIGEELKIVENIDSLVTVWGKIYRNKKVLQTFKFVNLNEIGTWDDGIFNLQVLQHADKVKIINKPLYHYRKYNASSITSIYKKNLLQLWKNKFTWIDNFLRDHQKPEIFHHALQNRICMTILGLCLNEMNNNAGLKQQYLNLRALVNDNFYISRFATFKLKSLSLNWKVFYFLVKQGNVLGILILVKIIHYLINRNNK